MIYKLDILNYKLNKLPNQDQDRILKDIHLHMFLHDNILVEYYNKNNTFYWLLILNLLNKQNK